MRPLSRLVVVASLVAAWLVLPAHPGHADQVSGGRLDWGVKASFRQYVVGPIAQGRLEVTGGATTTGDGLVRFHSASGDYQPGDRAYRASYSGGVRFTGHQRDNGSYQLDLTIANPTVDISGGSGTLYVDVTCATDTQRRVPFADLEISHVDIDGAGTVAASGVPATLTAEGAEAFAGYYPAGEPLDPATLTAGGAAVFNGFYREGTDMDPVTVAVPLTGGAELPALPDPGRDPSPRSVPATPAAAAAANQDGGPDPGLIAIAITSAVGAAIVAAAAGAAVRRRRRHAGEHPGEPDSTTSD